MSKEREMPTLYTRRFNLKDSLSDQEVVSHWRWMPDTFAPAVANGNRVHSVKLYSRHGALRAALTVAAEPDDPAAYQRPLASAAAPNFLVLSLFTSSLNSS